VIAKFKPLRLVVFNSSTQVRAIRCKEGFLRSQVWNILGCVARLCYRPLHRE